jgi:hypothetical protein
LKIGVLKGIFNKVNGDQWRQQTLLVQRLAFIDFCLYFKLKERAYLNFVDLNKTKGKIYFFFRGNKLFPAFI